jgi:hypothetical protein
MTALEASGKALQSGAVNHEKLAWKRYFRQFRGRGVPVAVEACGFWPAFGEGVEPEVKRLVLVHPPRVKAIASAKLKNDRVDSETEFAGGGRVLSPTAAQESGARGTGGLGAQVAGGGVCHAAGWRGL